MRKLHWCNTPPTLTVLVLIGMISPMLTVSNCAHAALGGDVTSIQFDQKRMQGVMQIKRTARYSVHEIQASHGRIVREYATPAGTVFAVTWQGPSRPDFKKLLGSYFDQFQLAVQEAKRSRMRRGPVVFEQPGFVVESGGHMRGFFGKAYLPDMLPEGMTAQDLQ